MLCPQATTGYLYITTTLPLSHPSSLVLLPLLISRLWQLHRIIPHVGWLFNFIIHFEGSSAPVCAISDLSWHKGESCQGETKHFFLLFFLFRFCHCQWYSEMVQCCYGYSQGFLPGIWKAVERKWKCWQNESLSATPLLFFKGQSVLTVATETVRKLWSGMHNATPKHLLFILTKVDVSVCRTEIPVPFRQGHPWRFLKNEHGAIFFPKLTLWVCFPARNIILQCCAVGVKWAKVKSRHVQVQN